MFSNASIEKRKNEMLNALKAVLPADAGLVLFEYDEKCFGNIIVEVELDNVKHIFITDRGEIVHNGKMLYDSSYLDREKTDPFHKLLEIIQNEMV